MVMRINNAHVAQTVTMLYIALQDIGYGFDAAVGMPGKAIDVLLPVCGPEIVKEQKGIKPCRIIESQKNQQRCTPASSITF